MENTINHISQTVPKVSVIIAAYNAAETLTSCVQSVLAQTMSDFEILIIDDKSGDQTLRIARNLQQTDQRISVIELERNGGPGAARNAGLDIAKADWIAIVDADDTILPERLSMMIEYAVRQSADIVFDNLIYIPKNSSLGKPYIKNIAGLSGHLTFADYVGSHLPEVSTENLGFLKPLIRRSFLNNIRYDETLRIGEDALLIMTLYRAGAKVCLMPDAYYIYKRHAGSVSYIFREDIAAFYNNKMMEFYTRYKNQFNTAENDVFLRFLDHTKNRMKAKRLASGLSRRNIFTTIRQAQANKRLRHLFAREIYINLRANVRRRIESFRQA